MMQGAQTRVLCDNLERWDGWEMEGGSGGRGHTYTHGWFHVDVWQKPTQHCKAIIRQLKILKKKNICQFDLSLAYSRMSGMMTNAIGGSAAGVGGLTDLSSLIQA